MRHRVQSSRFGRTSSHRAALLAGLVRALILERRIVTSLPKGRAAKSLAEKMMTLAKNGGLTQRRRAVQIIKDKKAVGILFSELAPHYKERSGGYCRITKIGVRRGDSSCMAILEWVGLSRIDRKKKQQAEEKEKA